MRAWEAAGLRREIPHFGSEPRSVADFVSNDYLGLARHPDVVAAARTALAEHGAGGRAARLLGGGSALDRIAEHRAAEWIGAESALLFPSGYQANLGVVSSLASRGDVVFSDALNHASLIDAARLSRAAVRIFEHNDLEHLATLLARSASARRRIVLTEGIFSMDGDLAPIAEIDEICSRYDASLIVDEAHSAGVVGPNGRGACALAEAQGADLERVTARILTGGKSLGASGAFVLGGSALTDHLLNRARSFVFTTAASPAVSGALACAIEIAAGADAERRHLTELVHMLAANLGVPEPPAAILPYVVGDPEAALSLAERTQSAGLDARAVRPPTVPHGTSRLRIVCHAYNEAADIGRLAELIASAAPATATAARRDTGDSEHTRPTNRGDNRLVVVGTDTDAGKTVVAALVVRALARRGAVHYWKPVQTGDDSDTRTVERLSSGPNVSFGEPAFEFALPASPHEAAHAENTSLDPGVVRTAYAELNEGPPTVVELAGGLLVPWTDDYLQADWLASERPPIILVARSGLGTLNHTMLTLEALEARGLTPRALFLVGPRHPSNCATLAKRVQPVFEVPIFEPLDTASMDEWLDRNDIVPALDLRT